MRIDLSPGERLLIKRALQLQAKVWLEAYRTEREPIAKEQIKQTIAAVDALAERFRKAIRGIS